MAQRFLYLIRHGQYHHADGDDGELTDTGLLQAQLTAEALRGLSVDALYTSPLYRARQTATIIAREFDHIQTATPCRDLRECIPSVPPVLHAYYTHVKSSMPPTEIETDDCQRRLDQAFHRYAVTVSEGADQYDVLVCHGNVIRFFVTRTLGIDVDTWMKMAIYNCGISLIVIKPSGNMALISHNEAGHLPLDLRTNN